MRRIFSIEARLSLRLRGAKIGRGVKFNGRVYCNQPDGLEIGDGCFIDDDVRFVTELSDGRLKIGSQTQINAGVRLDFSGGLSIGQACMISAQALIFTHSHGIDPFSKPVGIPKLIGDRVWIGTRSIILEKCSSVGDDSIVGAGAVVTRTVSMREVVAGNPARVICKRVEHTIGADESTEMDS